MRNCWSCGELGSFSGDFCPECQAKVDARGEAESKAYWEGAAAYKEGLDLCRNPYTFGERVFIKWADGWRSERWLTEQRKETKGI